MNKKLLLEIFISSLIVMVFGLGVFYVVDKKSDIPDIKFEPVVPVVDNIKPNPDSDIDGEVKPDYMKDINFRILNGNEWKLVVNNKDGYFYQYPSKPFSEYIYTGQGVWPPIVKIEKGDFKCDTEVSPNWPSYCVTKTLEGAMSRNYVTYTYKYKKDTNIVSFKFTIAYVNCGVFEQPKKGECEQENKDFRLDSLVGDMGGTLVLIEVKNFIPALVAGFKTYTNEKYNFQLDIPENWTLEKIGNTYSGVYYDNSFTFYSPYDMSIIGFNPGPIYTVAMGVVDSTGNTIYDLMKGDSEHKKFIQDLKQINLGGKTFTSYFDDGGQCGTYNLQTEHNSLLYTFGSCSGLEDNKDLEKIATSLRFTD